MKYERPTEAGTGRAARLYMDYCNNRGDGCRTHEKAGKGFTGTIADSPCLIQNG